MNFNKRYMHNGWYIKDMGYGYHPITGRWRASRHGVGMGANTERMLLRMIAKKLDDKRKVREV
jgi:hypothetical protein